MMLEQLECEKCHKQLNVSQRTKPTKYCVECKKEVQRQAVKERYYRKKKLSHSPSIRITEEHLDFINANGYSLPKLVRNMLDKMMEESKK